MSKAQINFTVDEDAKELAKEKLDHGELSERLRRAVEQVAFGEELSKRSQLETALDELYDREDELKRKLEEVNAELTEVQSKIERVEDRLADLQTKENEYEGALELLEEQLMNGTHVFAEHGMVKKAAHLGGCDAIDVIDDLRERNPSVPDYAFRQQMHVDQEWTGAKEGEV